MTLSKFAMRDIHQNVLLDLVDWLKYFCERSFKRLCLSIIIISLNTSVFYALPQGGFRISYLLSELYEN